MIQSADTRYLGMVLLLLIPNLALQMLKWHYLLKLANPKVRFFTACQSLIVGYPLGFVTPGRLGEIGRALYVKEISQIKTLKLVVVDKMANFLVILLIGMAGLATLPKILDSSQGMPGLLPGLALLTTVFLCLGSSTPVVSRALGRFTKIYHFRRKNLAALLAYSTLFYLTFAAQFVMLIWCFQPGNLGSVAKAVASTLLVKTVLPVSFGDLGVREGAAVFFCSKIGVVAAAGFNAAFLLFIINVGMPTVLGLPILMKTRREKTSP